MDKVKKIVEKVKAWFKKVGLTSVIYLLLFILTLAFGNLVLGIVGLKFATKFLAGAFLGIFFYINWNVIRKLLKEESKDLIDKVKDKIKKD